MIVGMAYSPVGRCEFTCTPPGMLSITVPFAALPRVTDPPAIFPVMLWALDSAARAQTKTMAKKLIDKRFFIYAFLLYLKAVDHRLSFSNGFVSRADKNAGLQLVHFVATFRQFEQVAKLGITVGAFCFEQAIVAF